jgi:hypothetical protein
MRPWEALARIWDVRRCFVCEQFGPCNHREPDADLASVFAMHERMQASDRQLVLPGFDAYARPEVERVH